MPMRLIRRGALLSLAISLTAGCSGSSKQQAPSQTAASTAQAGHEHSCEDCACGGDMSAASVSAENTNDGAALTFTTSEDKVAELRAHVQHMAEMHDRAQSGEAQPAPTAESDVHGATAHGHQGMPQQQEGLHTMQDGMPGHRQAMPMSAGGMVPSAVTVEEVPGGARLRFTPRDPSKLEELREHLKRRAERMQEGGCDMMQHHVEEGSSVTAR